MSFEQLIGIALELFSIILCWWIPWCVTRRLSIEVVSSQSHFPWRLELACSLLKQHIFFDQKFIILFSLKISPAIEFVPFSFSQTFLCVNQWSFWQVWSQYWTDLPENTNIKIWMHAFFIFLAKQDRLTLGTFLLCPLVSTGVTVLKIFEPSLTVKCL